MLYAQLARRLYIQKINDTLVNPLIKTFYTPALESIKATNYFDRPS